MKTMGILMILIIIAALSSCGDVIAHPGHGTPIVEPSDQGTGGTGSSDVSSSGSGSSQSGSGSSQSGSGSSQSGSESTSNDLNSAKSTDTGTAISETDSPENTGSATEAGSSGSYNESSGGPAMIGLIVVIGLVAMSFPYKEGGWLRNLQIQFFG